MRYIRTYMLQHSNHLIIIKSAMIIPVIHLYDAVSLTFSKAPHRSVQFRLQLKSKSLLVQLCIKFIKIKKFYSCLEQNYMDDVHASSWGQQVPQSGSCRGKGRISVCPEPRLGYTEKTAVPTAESAVWLVPLQQTAEILWNKALSGLCTWGPRSCSPHRQTQGASSSVI